MKLPQRQILKSTMGTILTMERDNACNFIGFQN